MYSTWPSLKPIFITQQLDWVAVGMGILIGFPYGWEWEIILANGNSHMLESYENSHRNLVGMEIPFPRQP